MSDPSSSATQEFHLGAVVGHVGGGGRLLIGSGHLELRTGALTKGLSHVEVVRHQGRRVRVYTARLMPPWMNCSLVVDDGQRSVLAVVPVWMRRRILAALRDNGYEVEQRSTLIERGYEAMTF